MDFASDNSVGASAEILAAVAAANAGAAHAYGDDDWTAKAQSRLDEIFERKTASFLVATGTAANALALAVLTPPYGAVFCHSSAHIMEDECGAPEFFTAGAKLVGIDGAAGKITPEALKAALAAFPRGLVTHVQPAVLSLSQATECGTLYTCAEIAELAAIAHAMGIAVHMDGARFANALVAQNCTAAEMSWKAGVDVLSFGATKNGALACEAVVFFNPQQAENFVYRRKRGGHTLSKGRFLGAQMAAYLEAGHWLALAAGANAHAARLAAGLAQVPGIRLVWPCVANEIFLLVPEKVDRFLRGAGAHYYDWTFTAVDRALAKPGDDAIFIRLVTSFATEPAEIAQFLAIAGAAATTSTKA
ncbi:low specificity L-threonine aldolase [Methylovirgula sp. HY1]|uniref:threonine aldolase family protein n=1 Tax=Methylovirgula sp. HY1 TaxID=2822761 RepID=UPI001C5B3C3F|nr:beta-eliminating lyase-related protein [Methylovirgula sp. HY1]QXX74631.1 Low specificity L-threonine aldolase [Methylovirgula sp. HY1]